MSKLHLSEKGNVVPTLCEELTTYRRARKVLHLPPTAKPGTLYILASPYKDSNLPLRLAINGTEVAPIAPLALKGHFWYGITVPTTLLKPGANTFEFWADATAMNAWSLAMENGHAAPQSYVSDDGGTTWRNEKMGYLNVGRGEYIVRMRLAEGEDPAPPAMVWEDPNYPRLARLREMMPAQALKPGPLMSRVRALMSWVSSAWEYRHSGAAAQYAPWDAETILAWGKAKSGHNGRLPIVMCVHYGVTFVTCCQALGIPARCAVFTGSINGIEGHFTAEVWFDEYRKWVFVDPNTDAILCKNGIPLSVTEIQGAGSDLSSLVSWGPGYQFQSQNPVMADWVKDNFLRGLFVRCRSIWPRADFLSHPELTPPGHGSTSYCETDLVWEERDLERGFGMFPYYGDAAYFDAPPQTQNK
ncbi:MAG: transglutaminase domain-containing protein [Anaerolineae bacterium]|nr:transglutaminase domain-containing protein [Anaerolineae bacterium]